METKINQFWKEIFKKDIGDKRVNLKTQITYTSVNLLFDQVCI